jgi:hypothetical protein
MFNHFESCFVMFFKKFSCHRRGLGEIDQCGKNGTYRINLFEKEDGIGKKDRTHMIRF